MQAEASAPVRFHLSINVSDLGRSVNFFKTLFGTEPAKRRDDYAKFELNDPPLVLSLEPHAPDGRGALNHAGFRFSNSAALVESQRRLELGGIHTEREEGVECCYARQTKFWVNDPDGGLWEFYTLDEDIEHRGAGQSSENMLPQIAHCGPVCAQPTKDLAVFEHRLGDDLALSQVDDGFFEEVRLRGTFNDLRYGAQIPDILADARRTLQPGGKLRVHVLTGDRPLNGEPLSLPGPAGRVKQVPVDRELLCALEDAQFSGLTLTTFRAAPCFKIGDVEMRETMIVGRKPAAVSTGEERVVLYKGPFLQVTDDEQRTFRRGERVTVPNAVWESLQRSPLADQFVCVGTGTPAACGAH